MAIFEIIGAGLVAHGTHTIIKTLRKDKKELRNILKYTFHGCKIRVKIGEKYRYPQIKKITTKEYGFTVQVVVPQGYSIKEFKTHKEEIEEATASRITIKQVKGRLIELELGTIPVHNKMDFNEELIKYEQLKVPYYTSFGIRYLDFNDEATCHIIVAGTTRMGKTVFLRLLFTQLILSTKGDIKFFYINNKIEDYYPMANVPQITEPAETESDALQMLTDVKNEIDYRKQKLRAAKDSVNVKEYNKNHPNDKMNPVFVVFDEYGRFSDSEEVQEKVVEIAETAGYLDIHLVISTQRPDATSVLKPRIRANILTRVCFQTADESNSKMVVHSDQAFHLDEIKGRAVILDGTQKVGQVPYISEQKTKELLEPYRVFEIEEGEIEIDEKRSDDIETVETLPSFVTGSIGADDMSECGETICNDQSNNEEISEGWSRLADTKT